jgi:hypothetical protein
MSSTRLPTFIIAVSLLAGAGIAAAQTRKECTDARIDARGAARAESDRRRQICYGNRECLQRAEDWWKARTREIDDERAACNARVRAKEQREPPPWANWKPGDPPPRDKHGNHYLMSCNGKVLGTYRPGGALEMELKTRGGSCHPAQSWGELNLKPGATPEWGYCRDGSWGHRSNGCVHASPPR